MYDFFVTWHDTCLQKNRDFQKEKPTQKLKNVTICNRFLKIGVIRETNVHNIMYAEIQRFGRWDCPLEGINPLYYILSLHTKRKELKKWRSRVKKKIRHGSLEGTMFPKVPYKFTLNHNILVLVSLIYKRFSESTMILATYRPPRSNL